MIRSINRKYPQIKIKSKKTIQSKPTNVIPQNEIDQMNAEKYFLQVFEKNIQSLKSQTTSLQDTIFDLKKQNSYKENQITAQKQFLREKEEKINKRQIALLPHLEEFHKKRFSNGQVKQKNKFLVQKLDKIKKLLTKTCNELEELNNENCFNFNDTYEVYQMELFNVETLQSKINLMKSKSINSHQNNIINQQVIKDCDQKEKEMQLSIEDAKYKLFQLQEKQILFKIQLEVESFDYQSQLNHVEILESKIKQKEELIQSKINEQIENELIEARNDYESFIREIAEKKKMIFEKQKEIYLQKEKLVINYRHIDEAKKEETNAGCNNNSNDENIDNDEIISTICEQLNKRSTNYESLSAKLQSKQTEYEQAKSRIAESWADKTKKIDILKAKYRMFQKKQAEILFQSNKINDFKEKAMLVDAKLSKVINNNKIAQSTIQSQEEKLQKIHDKELKLSQKEKEAMLLEEKLNERKQFLIQKENEISSREQQIQMKENNLLQMEKEAQLLKDSLTKQMKILENELLVTPFHEKIGLTA